MKSFRIVGALLVVLTLAALQGGVHLANAAGPKTSSLETVIVRLAPQPTAQPAFMRRTHGLRSRLKLDLYTAEAGHYLSALQTFQTGIMRAVLGAIPEARLGWRYAVAFDGFSVTLPRAEVSRLGHVKGVAGVYPTRTYYPLLDQSNGVNLINAPAAWQVLGGGPNAGHGVLIGHIDSGIDISNPLFSDRGFSPPSFGRRADTTSNYQFTNNKVVIARAFGPDPNSSATAQDVFGHGTFTAGLEAGDYNTPTPLGVPMSGVAPGAWLANYNVFLGGGTTSDTQILAALDAASLDGVDLINMSLGAPQGDAAVDPWTYAVQSLTSSGIPVVVAAGNSGPSAQSLGSPASAPDAIAVGAVTNSNYVSNPLHVTGPGTVPPGLQTVLSLHAAQVTTITKPVGPAGYVYVGLGRKPGDDPVAPKANDFAGKDLHGKIALIERGDIFFSVKVENAAAQGAIAAIIFDNHVESPLPSITVGTATLPSYIVSQADGNALLSWLRQHPGAQITIDPRTLSQQVGDVVTSFSPQGPTSDFTIKPDVMAPGAGILSGAEANDPNGELYNSTGFDAADGTSASAPFVTGIAALLLQTHPKWTPAQVKDALMNTASANVYDNAAHTQLAPITQQGGGLVNADAALTTPALVSPPALSLGEYNLARGPLRVSRSLTLTDVSGQGGTWSVAATVTQGSGIHVNVPSSASVTAGGQTSVPLTFSLTKPASAPVYAGGYVTFTSGKTTLHVPFLARLIDHAQPATGLLLLDASYPAKTHSHIAAYYEAALAQLHRPYTYWNEEALGSPALTDLERARDVFYFTGANTGDVAADAPISPVLSTDQELLRQYLRAGGHLFINGMAVALSSPAWTVVVLGAGPDTLSLFDNSGTDPNSKGGVGPSRPSGVGVAAPFRNMQPIDLSKSSTSANDNTAIFSFSAGVVGVAGLQGVNVNLAPLGHPHGHVVMRASTACGTACAGDGMAVANSDEPSLSHAPTYHGRSLYFSFGFEGISNGSKKFASRTAVLERVLNWLDDQPTVRVVRTGSSLHATLTSTAGAKPSRYQWQLSGGPKHASTKAAVSIRKGLRRVRVAITDTLGHVAVSPWLPLSSIR